MLVLRFALTVTHNTWCKPGKYTFASCVQAKAKKVGQKNLSFFLQLCVCEIYLYLSDKLCEKKITLTRADFVPVLWYQFGGKHSVSLKDGKSPSSLMSHQQLWIQDTIVRSIVTDNTGSTCFDRGRWMGCKSQCGLRVSKWGKKQGNCLQFKAERFLLAMTSSLWKFSPSVSVSQTKRGVLSTPLWCTSTCLVGLSSVLEGDLWCW